MKPVPIIIVIISVFFIAGALSYLQAAERLNDGQYEIVLHTLANGLKVLILEKHTMPVVAVQLWYNVGSVDEPNSLKGIAHLFEHMMFRGSKNFGPEDHSRLIRAVGGQCNAYTTDETTVYFEKVPADKLELVLTLEADRMAWLKLDQGVLDTERQVIMEEYRQSIDNSPVGSIEKKVRQFLFPECPYEFGPIGRMEDIAKFSVEDCQRFFDTFYSPSNVVLIIVGDIKADQVVKMVEAKFGFIKPSKAPDRPKLVIQINKVSAKNSADTELPMSVTILAFYTAGACDSDKTALELLFNCLAQGRSSRLWKVLVRDKKIVERFVADQEQGQNNGLIFFAGVHPPYLSGKVRECILQQLEKIKTDGLEDSEFMKSRNQLHSKKVFERYYAEKLASSIGYSEVVRGDYKLFYKVDQEIESVTQADIIRVANRYFNRDNMKIIYFEPKERKFLAGFAEFIKSIFN
jgi:zinc protease